MVEAMEIQKGFRQTEVGVIPSDWKVQKLTNIAEICTGSTPPTSDQNNYGDDYYFVSPADLGKGRIILNTEKKLSLKGFNLSRKYPKNSILFTCIGSTIGKSGIADIELTSNQQINAIFPNNTFDSDYLYYLLNLLANKIKQSAGETAVPIINKTEFGELSFPLPPTKAEQTAIATALNDADALISQLEKFIAKKRAIKQGAMQELLKPKDGWEVKKLGDFIDYEQPTKYLVSDTEYNDHNQTPVLTAGKTFILGYANEEFGIFNNLPVIIFDDFTTASKYVDFQFKAKSSAMKILKPKKDVNLRFIFELIQTIKFDSTDHKRYWISEYQNIEVKVPKQDDQDLIAQILSDMDTEIEALEKKLKKYKMLKQGMMQNLLTGRIRLV